VEDVFDERPAVPLRERERDRAPDEDARDTVDGAPERTEEVARNERDDLSGDRRDDDLKRLNGDEHERSEDAELLEPQPQGLGVRDETRVLADEEVEGDEREPDGDDGEDPRRRSDAEAKSCIRVTPGQRWT